MITWTGVPVSVSNDPACAKNTSGISSCDGARRSRTAITTTTGSRAATAPLTLMSAVSPATMSIISTSRRARPSPAQAISRWPTQVVTPVASSASLTTNSAAMNRTVGSPKPARAWSSVSTPVAHSATAAPTATASTGTRPHTNRTTTAATIANVMVMSSMAGSAGQPGVGSPTSAAAIG